MYHTSSCCGHRVQRGMACRCGIAFNPLWDEVLVAEAMMGGGVTEVITDGYGDTTIIESDGFGDTVIIEEDNGWGW